MPVVDFFVQIDQSKHRQKMDASCLVEDAIQSLVATYQLQHPSSDYELYWVTPQPTTEPLARNARLEILGAKAFSIVELRERGSQSIFHYTNNTTIFSLNDQNTLPPRPIDRQPYQNRMKCYVEISKGQRIAVQPHNGLIIDRALIEAHLSRSDRFKLWVKGLSSQETPLRFVSRENHCQIYLDMYFNRWIIEAGTRSIYIEQRVYQAGQQVQLYAGMTMIRLGREGVFITAFLSDI